MSIAEKLTTIAENEQKVYDAGKQAEYDAFWNAIQTNGNRTKYDYAFYGEGWTNSTFTPKYHISPTTAQYMFAYSKITDLTKYDIDLTNLSEANLMFRGSSIKKIGTVKSTSMASIFYACQAPYVEKVILPDVSAQTSTSAFSGMFSYYYYLETIDFEGYFGQSVNAGNSWNLLPQSIVNFVEHLSDDVTGKKLTLSNTAVTKADWSTTDYASFDELIATKPNWTISLT